MIELLKILIIYFTACSMITVAACAGITAILMRLGIVEHY